MSYENPLHGNGLNPDDAPMDVLRKIWHTPRRRVIQPHFVSQRDVAAVEHLIGLGLVREHGTPPYYEVVEPLPDDLMPIVSAPLITAEQVRERLHETIDALGYQLGLFVDDPGINVTVHLDLMPLKEILAAGRHDVGDVVDVSGEIRIVVARQHTVTDDDLRGTG